MFALDRDLLVLEPNLFRDVAWVGQRLVDGAVGTIAGTTITLSGADLAAQGVTAGHVMMVQNVPVEVVDRLTGTTATVSRVRAGAADAAITPTPVAGASVRVTTFLPQLGMAHAQTLRLLGIQPGGWSAGAGGGGPGVASGELTEASVTNPEALRLYEALAALYLIYAGAASVSGAASAAATQMAMYKERMSEERQRASVGIDTDGDGRADVVRRLNTFVLTRG